MNIFFNYFAIFILFICLFLTGIIFFKRITTERRAQIVLPAGSIFGICFYIFLLNITAHFVKGVSGFWTTLIIQILLALIIKKFNPSIALFFPKAKEARIWIFLMILWVVFLYQITAHATTDGADSTLHQSFAARFIRGDYPMHAPWQPDYIGFYHYGGAELLGSLHSLTGAPYYFLHPFIAFWMLLGVSQILTWIIPPEKKSILSLSLAALVGLISLGGFFIAWPVKLEWLPSFSQLPTLGNAFENYGSPTNLDALVFFLHRCLAISFLISLLVLLIYPKKNLLSFFSLAIFLAAIALTDESVLVVSVLPILIISFLNIFNKSIKIFVLSLSLIFVLIAAQGGLITESLLNRYGSSNVLLFPADHSAVTEKYLSYRLAQQKSKFYPVSENLKLFSWFHPGIIWQLLFYLICVIFLFKKSNNKELKNLSLILLLSAIISLVAFYGLVPKGYTHPNGNRFLALSYYLSGLGLAYFLVWFSQEISKQKKFKVILNLIIIWILLTSLMPPFIQLFPRKKDNWFIINPHSESLINKWIKENIPLDKRIVALTEKGPSNSINMDLVKEVGVLTPVWIPKPRVHDSFDISPAYADLHYSLNPDIIKSLKIDYILISNLYFSQLPKERQKDILNKEFFNPIFASGENVIILRVMPKFLSEGKNLDGTFSQLEQIAPLDGTYCLDYPPNISENVYRILRLLLYKRRTYCDKGGAFYNARIDIDLNPRIDKPNRYDFLVLGKDVDPQNVCHCQATILWEGLGTSVKLWKTN